MRSSNTSRDRRVRPHAAAAVCLVALLTGAWAIETAYALDPARALSQYLRDRWGVEQGFPGGRVYAITQTTDGYLWIGTEKGLVRFDGVTFRIVQPSARTTFSIAPVLGLEPGRDGGLFALLFGPTLVRYPPGQNDAVTPDVELPDSLVAAMARRSDGSLIVASLRAGVLALRGGRPETLVAPEAMPKSFVISIAETRDGTLWLGTRDSGLFRVSGGGAPVAMREGLPDGKINCLQPGGDRELWIGTDHGAVRFDGTAITKAGVPAILDGVQVLTMTRDRDGNVWFGATSRGLVRVDRRGGATVDARANTDQGDVTALFDDREGNLWIGGARGLERLRAGTFASYATAEGLPSDGVGAVYVDAERRTWFAPLGGGLFVMRDGRIERSPAVTGDDVVYSIAGRDRDVWIGRQRGGLTHLRGSDEATAAAAALMPTGAAQTITQAQGLAQNSVYAVLAARDGSVWAGTLSGGVSRIANGPLGNGPLGNGAVTTYTVAHGLASNMVTSILQTKDGTVWCATPEGVSAWTAGADGRGQWKTYRQGDGLPSDNVFSLTEDASGTLWMGTAEGPAWMAADRGAAGGVAAGSIAADGRAVEGRPRPHVPPRVPAVLRDQIFGIEDDGRGSLWMATPSRVLQVRRDALMQGTLGASEMAADVREYGVADGLLGLEPVKRHRTVVKDPLGRIWFAMSRGLSVVDPARVSVSTPPAIVHVQAISADGVPVQPREGGMRVPSGRQRVMVSYAGLSLSVPDRVRYRYRLDGFDREWSEPVAAREAVFTNLAPGPYRFRVMASNSDGLWSGTEASMAFDVDAAFWQTLWFKLSAGLAIVAAAVALYRIRMHQVAKQLNVRFEERLAERTRIAQELHDTLLQGFVSASMQLHVAADRVPSDSPAKPILVRVQTLMAQVIDEGRNAVRGLRSTAGRDTDLEHAFSRVPQEIAVARDPPVGFRVIVEGRPRALHPIIRDEVYRIGREALVNAFRHSGAGSIEVQLDYAAAHVRVLVRDNGCGIDPAVLASGRDGHWGLSGMRERAERIGARVKVWSRAAAGTEVELFVPGPVAFQFPSSSGGMWRWFRKKRVHHE